MRVYISIISRYGKNKYYYILSLNKIINTNLKLLLVIHLEIKSTYLDYKTDENVINANLPFVKQKNGMTLIWKNNNNNNKSVHIFSGLTFGQLI